jgi:quinol monooxygenase YgiN
MSHHVAWMLHMTVAPGRQAELQALLDEMVAATLANEPGTLEYEWSLSADGTECHLWERYADSEAALIHMGSFVANYAERFYALLTTTAFHLYGSPNAEVREGLGAFGAVIMRPLGGFRRG